MMGFCVFSRLVPSTWISLSTGFHHVLPYYCRSVLRPGVWRVLPHCICIPAPFTESLVKLGSRMILFQRSWSKNGTLVIQFELTFFRTPYPLDQRSYLGTLGPGLMDLGQFTGINNQIMKLKHIQSFTNGFTLSGCSQALNYTIEWSGWVSGGKKEGKTFEIWPNQRLEMRWIKFSDYLIAWGEFCSTKFKANLQVFQENGVLLCICNFSKFLYHNGSLSYSSEFLFT